MATTLYNIHIMATFPEAISSEATPMGQDVMVGFESVLAGHKLQPIAAQIERNDEEALQYESRAWIKNLPAALLLAVAERLDEELAARTNPLSPGWDGAFVDKAAITQTALARDIIQKSAHA